MTCTAISAAGYPSYSSKQKCPIRSFTSLTGKDLKLVNEVVKRCLTNMVTSAHDTYMYIPDFLDSAGVAGNLLMTFMLHEYHYVCTGEYHLHPGMLFKGGCAVYTVE